MVIEVFLGLRALNATACLIVDWATYIPFVWWSKTWENNDLRCKYIFHTSILRSPSQTNLNTPVALARVTWCHLLGRLSSAVSRSMADGPRTTNSPVYIRDKWTEASTVVTLTMKSRCCFAMNTPLAERKGRTRSAVRHKRHRRSFQQRTRAFTDSHYIFTPAVSEDQDSYYILWNFPLSLSCRDSLRWGKFVHIWQLMAIRCCILWVSSILLKR